MSITRIEIENYKSVERCALSLRDVNLLIGENGTGKSNILDALCYFYASLLNDTDDRDTYNYDNRYCNEFYISVTFDFTHLRKISVRNKGRDVDSNYLGYYEWISRRGQQETLRLHKVKGHVIQWNRDRKYRQNIFNLFPMYHVDARTVNLKDWGQLWEIIGDLMKVHRSKESEIAAEINAIKDNDAYKLQEKFSRLSESFAKANIQIRPYTPKQYATAIASLLFNGDTFEFKRNRLDYMSNGTNAFTYTNLLLEILTLISEFKIKDPIVVLDEPEISLHHQLIDQLSTRIFDCGGTIRMIIASHSPRLLKNVLKAERFNCEVFHVSSCGGSTKASPVRLFSQEEDRRPRVFMTDQHANAYFARCILSVEGASEMEVFTNLYIQQLFPFLRDVDIMEGMSNDIVQQIISPKQRQFHTPYLLLMDMDKVLTKCKGRNAFTLENKFFPDTARFSGCYDYTPRRTEQALQKKRILAMAQNSRFHYWYPFYSCKDPAFQEFLSLIQTYLLNDKIYAAKTTIEGMLINSSNLSSFWPYYLERNGSGARQSALAEIYASFLKNDRLNFARLLHDGKSDYILKLDEIKSLNPQMDVELYNLMESSRVKKTSGWMTDWLDYRICRSIEIDSEQKDAWVQFRRATADPQIRAIARKSFRYHFPELYRVFQLLQEQMSLH